MARLSDRFVAGDYTLVGFVPRIRRYGRQSDWTPRSRRMTRRPAGGKVQVARIRLLNTCRDCGKRGWVRSRCFRFLGLPTLHQTPALRHVSRLIPISCSTADQGLPAARCSLPPGRDHRAPGPAQSLPLPATARPMTADAGTWARGRLHQKRVTCDKASIRTKALSRQSFPVQCL